MVNTTLSVLNHDHEMTKEIEEIYRTTMNHKPYIKNSFHKPVFAEESFPLVKTNPTNQSFDNALISDSQFKFLPNLDHSRITLGGNYKLSG